VTRRSYGIAAALLFVAAIAAAQGPPGPLPPGKWWQKPEVVRHLELTSPQQQKLDEIFRTAANELIDARGEAEKQQIALRSELERPQLRKKDIQAIATKLSEARAKLFERELMMLVDMRSVLNDAQWEKLRRHMDERGERRGPPPHRRP
jgi:Spy/CpxP family protein refolding chaperone